jgi:hypothetical protein
MIDRPAFPASARVQARPGPLWQNLPEMARSTPARLAGISAGLSLAIIWHLRAAADAAADGDTAATVARCNLAMTLDGDRRVALAALDPAGRRP